MKSKIFEIVSDGECAQILTGDVWESLNDDEQLEVLASCVRMFERMESEILGTAAHPLQFMDCEGVMQ